LPKSYIENSVLQISENGEFSISEYKDTLTTENIIKQVAKIKYSFPTLPSEFFEIFTDRIKDKGFTDKRLNDAVNNVIDNCIYPSPTIAQFIAFDKRIKLNTYQDMLKLIHEGDSFDNYDMKEIENKKYWIKK
jgi:hypothetical protein